MHGNQGVPVVGRSYLYGIDVLALQEAFVFLIDITTYGHGLLFLPVRHVATEAFAFDAIHVAAGCHLYSRTCCKAAEVAASLLTESYEAKHDSVARSNAFAVNGEAG